MCPRPRQSARTAGCLWPLGPLRRGPLLLLRLPAGSPPGRPAGRAGAAGVDDLAAGDRHVPGHGRDDARADPVRRRGLAARKSGFPMADARAGRAGGGRLLYPFLAGAVRDLRRAQLSLDALIALGALAAIGLSAVSTLRGRGEVYFDTALMLLVLVTGGGWLRRWPKAGPRRWLNRSSRSCRPATRMVDGGSRKSPPPT